MKKLLFFLGFFISGVFLAEAKTMMESMNRPFIAERCTVTITGNLHTRHSNCNSGVGSCIRIVITLPKKPVPGGGRNVDGDSRGIITVNPTDPSHAVVDFLLFDDEQMTEEYWEVESDILINDPNLAEEPGGYNSITLLKGKYPIDRTKNKVGQCTVSCKVS